MEQLILFTKFENLRPNMAVYVSYTALFYKLGSTTDANESNFTGGPFTRPLTP